MFSASLGDVNECVRLYAIKKSVFDAEADFRRIAFSLIPSEMRSLLRASSARRMFCCRVILDPGDDLAGQFKTQVNYVI